MKDQLIYEEFQLRRKAPSNLIPEDEGLFKREFLRTVPAIWQNRFSNCMITHEGIIIKGFGVVESSVAGYEEFVTYKLKYILSSYLKRRRIYTDNTKTHVLTFDRYAVGYFHFMGDVIPRLIECELYFNTAVFIFPDYFNNGLYKQVIDSFPIKEKLFLKKNEWVKVKDLIMPSEIDTSGNYHPGNLKKMVNHLKKKFDPETEGQDYGDKLFISREKAAWRYLVNEKEVQELLKRSGFKVVHLEDHTFAEQVRICSGAKYMIGSHGAGLTNCMFVPAGGSILELRKKGDAHNNCYYSLACASGLYYYYQTCDYIDKRAGNYFDLKVDLDLLEKNVNLMLKK